MAVGKTGIDSTRMTAPCLCGHAEVRRSVHTAHAISSADSRVPEIRATLDFIRLIQSVIGGRVGISAGTNEAGSRHSHGPDATPIGAIHPNANLVKKKRSAGAVQNI